MKIEFSVLKKARELVMKEIEDLTLEQLHTIPNGFSNNIAWNVAHLVVTQQLLHYGLSGNNMLCPDDLIENYRKGTFPKENFSEEEFNSVKELLLALPETLEEDYEAGIFDSFKEYPTSTGYVLTSIEQAIAFNNFHEGLHYGIIRSIKKLVA